MNKTDEFKPVEVKLQNKLVYDVESTPKGLSMGDFTKLYEQHNVVFWDSSRGGTKPKIYGVNGNEDLLIVDCAEQELDLDFYAKKFQQEEFWDREIHNCKNSPIYFFSNYGTSVWPHNDKDLKAYMEEIGIGAVVAKDDAEAKVLWEKQKLKVKEAMASLTVEFLQERKGVIDVLKAIYDVKVNRLEKKLEGKVRLVDSNNVPLEDRKRIGNLVEKIRKNLPVLPKYSDKYRTPKGKWDNSMLFVTNYDTLLEIFDDVLQSREGEK